jgi:hypothetical protein
MTAAALGKNRTEALQNNYRAVTESDKNQASDEPMKA